MSWSFIVMLVSIVLGTSLLTIYISARRMRPFYGGHTREAFRHQLQLIIGQTRDVQIIEDGEVVYPSNTGPVLGPRLVIIRPGNAVTMCNGGQITRVAGPGIFKSKQFEYVKDVFNLRERQESYALEDVLCHDLIATSAKVSVCYTLDIAAPARQGAAALSAGEQALLKQLPFSMPKWREGARSAVEQSVRQVISSLPLEDLLTRTHMRTLEQRIVALANQRTLAWGVRVSSVIIECLHPESEITGAASDLWIAGMNVDVEIKKSQAFHDALLIVADAYQVAAGMGMPDEAIRREILRRMMEQFAKDPAAKIILTPGAPSF